MVEERIAGRLVLNQPAGHLEAGESLLEAVVRETREETAFQVEPRALTGVYQWRQSGSGSTFLRFCFHCAVVQPMDTPLDREIVQVHWLRREQLAAGGWELRSPMVMRCLDDYLAGRRVGLEHLVQLS